MQILYCITNNGTRYHTTNSLNNDEQCHAIRMIEMENIKFILCETLNEGDILIPLTSIQKIKL